MPQLRKDPVNGRWVIVNVETPKLMFPVRAHVKSSKACPFCPGNESMTPPEIAAYRLKNLPAGKTDWQVRVIPNKFPALRIEESAERRGAGIYDRIGGFGAHEVIIENPDHQKEMADLGVEEVALILRAYRERCLDLNKDKRIRYILIFKNYGSDAGASLEHPHSQLIGLPIVPSRVLGELFGSANHYELTERCVYCDMLEQEKTDKKITVYSEDGFTTIAPFAARFPFEMWLLPASHISSFDSISDEGLLALAKALKASLGKLKNALGDPSYNFMIHTAPLHGRNTESFHWHMEIIPHLTEVDGFELGTGFYQNPTPPEMAAEKLRVAEPKNQ